MLFRSECGLVIVQIPCGDNGLSTMLIHTESGEFVCNDYYMKPEKVTPQSQGSVVSYQRRYCIQSLLMLSFEEDDDANLATHGKKAPDEPVKKQSNNLPWLNKGTDEYNQAVKFMQGDEADINRIKKSFKLSKETESFLLNQIK